MWTTMEFIEPLEVIWRHQLDMSPNEGQSSNLVRGQLWREATLIKGQIRKDIKKMKTVLHFLQISQKNTNFGRQFTSRVNL